MNEIREVYTFGQNAYGELAHSDTTERHVPTLVEFCTQLSVTQVAAGNELTLILTDNGDVYSSGYNEAGNSQFATSGMLHQTNKVGMLKPIEKLRGKNVIKIFAANGCEHVVALCASGDVYTFGFNARGQLGHGDTTSHAVPRQVSGLDRKFVTTVGCSYYHSIFACADDMEVYACGRNDYGQLGLGMNED